MTATAVLAFPASLHAQAIAGRVTDVDSAVFIDATSRGLAYPIERTGILTVSGQR